MNRTKSGIYTGTDSTNVKLMFKEVCLFFIKGDQAFYPIENWLSNYAP